MKESAWGYLIIALGLVIVAVLFLVQNLTSTSEQDYYLSREILKSSMYDAIDYGTYMTSGKLVMSREKFVSVFTRRFAESVNADRTYELDFYDIYEYPPKATIRIKTNTGETVINGDGFDMEVNTFITGILETTENNGEFNIIYSTATGDMNNDNAFSGADIPLLEAFIAEHKGNCVDEDNRKKIDISGNGICDIEDLVLLKKALYGGTPLDLDGNGVFNKEDYNIVQKCASKSNPTCKNDLSDKQYILADTNNNGNVDIKDCKKIHAALPNGVADCQKEN